MIQNKTIVTFVSKNVLHEYIRIQFELVSDLKKVI